MAAKVSDNDKGTTKFEVNYEEAKKDFLQLVQLWLDNQTPANKYLYDAHSKEKKETIIKEILSTENQPRSRHLDYEVHKKNGKNVLALKKKHKFGPIVQVLDWEEIFDVFMPLHEKSGHKGREDLISMAGKGYKIPTMCLTFFKRVCNVCINDDIRRELRTVSRIGLVFVINMVQMRIDEQFRYLLIYADKETNFVVLRPLIAKTDLEISTELFRIFTQFGPPEKLHIHGYNSGLTMKIRNSLKDMCPEFKTIKIEHKPVSFDLPTIVTDKIQDWMTTTKSDVWEIGCCIVQRQMNCEPKIDTNKREWSTPHSLFFHTNRSKEREGFCASIAQIKSRKRGHKTKSLADAVNDTTRNTRANSLTTARDIVETQVKGNFNNVLQIEDDNSRDLTDDKLEEGSMQTIESGKRINERRNSSNEKRRRGEESQYSIASIKTEPMDTDEIIPIKDSIQFEAENEIKEENLESADEAIQR